MATTITVWKKFSNFTCILLPHFFFLHPFSKLEHFTTIKGDLLFRVFPSQKINTYFRPARRSRLIFGKVRLRWRGGTRPYYGKLKLRIYTYKSTYKRWVREQFIANHLRFVLSTNTKNVRSSLGAVFVCSFPDSQDFQESWGVGRVLWVQKVVRSWFVTFSWFARSLSKNKFYELFANLYASSMFASV